MKKIYISGAITGLAFEESERIFSEAATEFRDKGYEVLNPLELTKTYCKGLGAEISKLKWADFMHIDLAYLSICDAIYMIPGWTKSNGAQCEYFFAKGMGIEIIDGDPLPFGNETPKTVIKYVRLLSYPEAEKLVDFINRNEPTEYANITTGGVCMRIFKSSLPGIIDFLKNNALRSEIGNEHPEKVCESIISVLKSGGVI